MPQLGEPFFGSASLGYVADVDRYDPAAVASRLPAAMQVLVTCSANDAQVHCSDVDHLVQGLNAAHVAVNFVHLTGMDHGLKPDTSSNGANNTAGLPMAPGLARALAQFAKA